MQVNRIVYDYLDNLYKDRYYTSGIPAGIYMDAIDNNWLKDSSLPIWRRRYRSLITMIPSPLATMPTS